VEVIVGKVVEVVVVEKVVIVAIVINHRNPPSTFTTSPTSATALT
jgi:hypothetical protein